MEVSPFSSATNHFSSFHVLWIWNRIVFLLLLLRQYRFLLLHARSCNFSIEEVIGTSFVTHLSLYTSLPMAVGQAWRSLLLTCTHRLITNLVLQCFPFNGRWYQVYRNHERDHLLGDTAKCVSCSETGAFENGVAPVRYEFGNNEVWVPELCHR